MKVSSTVDCHWMCYDKKKKKEKNWIRLKSRFSLILQFLHISVSFFTVILEIPKIKKKTEFLKYNANNKSHQKAGVSVKIGAFSKKILWFHCIEGGMKKPTNLVLNPIQSSLRPSSKIISYSVGDKCLSSQFLFVLAERIFNVFSQLRHKSRVQICVAYNVGTYFRYRLLIIITLILWRWCSLTRYFKHHRKNARSNIIPYCIATMRIIFQLVIYIIWTRYQVDKMVFFFFALMFVTVELLKAFRNTNRVDVKTYTRRKT